MMKSIVNLSWEKWFSATIILIIGLNLINEGCKTYSLVCTRTEKAPNICKISNFALSGTEVKQFPLNQLKEAKFKESKSPKSRIITVVLITENEAITFGSRSSKYANKKQKIVSEINTFLQNSKQLTLSVKEPSSFSLTLYGIITSGIALLLFFGRFEKSQ